MLKIQKSKNMLDIKTILGTLILIGVLVVIYLLISKNNERVRTKITLVKKYQGGDILYFSKTFKGLLPKIDFVMIFDEPIKTVNYYFDAEKKLVTLVAVDEKNQWSSKEYDQLCKENWECKNIMYIPKM
jgi:hypothetical protein